ncbi:MAG: DUF1009 domain-containing protein [Micavibrio aeruginosavorus]|uniref:DUF1009 domain-containing protein n=1 Tax=Micavibrio aeruginosavorus TaxID=349221 RepID=A0A2W5MV24_9BACT|nr:MAG: DUF1009 domain-containing protein [Micavibrio aeruginosavorus]
MALPSKLGIVAGGGTLPEKLLEFCDSRNIETFTIGFENQTDPRILEGRAHMMTRIGAAGSIIKILKDKSYQDLVLIGSIRRPHLSEMRPDLYTAAFFAKLGLRALGDDNLLKAVHGALAQEGFTLHGIHELMQDLLMPEGILGRAKPSKAHQADIDAGFGIAKAIGALDIGQSIVIQDGIVLGVEGVEGTDELIRRCAEYRRTRDGGILVKTCKPEQDRKIDMPTIGPQTIALCASLGYSGVAVEAASALMVDMQQSIQMADESKLFLIGVRAPARQAADE